MFKHRLETHFLEGHATNIIKNKYFCGNELFCENFRFLRHEGIILILKTFIILKVEVPASRIKLNIL